MSGFGGDFIQGYLLSEPLPTDRFALRNLAVTAA
jgi:EAL domain-containing protein (putative c-di-GMP-specific phosphodiesterase class I)